jgi:hypothetical protein
MPQSMLEAPVMIMVCAQWQSEVMTILQGDFEEELRRMSVVRDFDPPRLPETRVPGANVSSGRSSTIAPSTAAIQVEDE